MYDEDPDDLGPGTGQPLPPDDRLWRHPSEIGAAMAGPARAAQPRPGRSRSFLAVAAVAGVVGAVVAVAAVAVTGSLSPRIVEREAALPVSSVSSAPPSPKTVTALASDAGRLVARVEIAAGGGARTGSAVVVGSDGVLVTSRRLVAGAETVTVHLPDGRSLAGTVRGTDPDSGIAVVTVEATGLRAAEAASHEPAPGDPAVAVAAPDRPAASPSVTAGVVSALDRSVDGPGSTWWGLIETDRPVAERADGGALVDADGRVLGVCLHSDASAMAGYALPLAAAMAIADDLLAHGAVRRAWLGIEGADAPRGGVEVTAVTPGGPAEAGRLAVGDVVVAVGPAEVHAMADLVAALRALRPGDVAELTVHRAGVPVTVAVTLAPKP